MTWVQDTTIAFEAQAEERKISLIPILVAGGGLLLIILLSRKKCITCGG